MGSNGRSSNKHGTRINPLNAKLNPICHLLPLLGGHHILHVSRIRVKFMQFCRALFTLNKYSEFLAFLSV